MSTLKELLFMQIVFRELEIINSRFIVVLTIDPIFGSTLVSRLFVMYNSSRKPIWIFWNSRNLGDEADSASLEVGKGWNS